MNEKLSTMNLKYKIKFYCKQPWKTRTECSWQIIIPHDWHCPVNFGALSFSFFVWLLAMCNWRLLLCPVPVNLLSTFGNGSSTKSVVPRNIFIFNCTLDAKPFNFFVVHVEKPRLLSYSSWSHTKMCLKYLNCFSNTAQCSHWL